MHSEPHREGESAPSEEVTASRIESPLRHLAQINAWPEEPIPTEWLRNGHARWELLMNEYTGADQVARQGLFRWLAHEVRLHIAAEEGVVFPAWLAVSPKATQRVSRFQTEHREINKMLSKLMAGRPAGERFELLFSKWSALLERHAENEETALFADMEADLADQSREVSEQISRLEA